MIFIICHPVIGERENLPLFIVCMQINSSTFMKPPRLNFFFLRINASVRLPFSLNNRANLGREGDAQTSLRIETEETVL